MIKKILIYLSLLLVLIQFIPYENKVPVTYTKDDFFKYHIANKPVVDLIKNACYDCHSYQSQYPWYGKVAPMAWSIHQHVAEGRARINFDDWMALNPDQQKHAISQSINTLKNLSMPMPSYMAYHPKANINKQQRELLIAFFQSIQTEKK